MTIRVTIDLTYEADPNHYDSADPAEMAAQDDASFNEGQLDLVDLISNAKEIVSVDFRPEDVRA